MLVLAVLPSAYAQKASQSRLYDVCGDTNRACQTSGSFRDEDMPMRITGELEWFGEYKSKPFYAVIVQSRKAIEGGGPADNDCGGQFSAAERSKLQKIVPSNRVFSSWFGCYHFDMSYTNVNHAYNFLAVYGGESEAAARTVLKTLKNQYPGANIRKMQAVFCNGCH